MLDGTTIVACATPPGRSARAVVRCSGPGTAALLNACFSSAPSGRGALAGLITLCSGWRLPVLLLRYVAPASYTGEDAAEIVLPGNPALVERVLSSLTAQPGVRLAGPGEFTARAHLNGKLALAEAEGVAALIAARTDEEWLAAQSLLRGEAGSVYRRWSDELATVLALIEAGLDFADQEGVTAISADEAHARLTALKNDIEKYLVRAGGAEAPIQSPRVVLAGEPNTGKSTLFNALLGRRRAVESPRVGTTRDALAEPLALPSGPWGAATVTLIDLPGLEPHGPGMGPFGPAAAAQAAARAQLETADVLVHCDPTGRFAGIESDRPTLRVRTKADRPGGHADADCISVCALDGWNLTALRAAIVAAAGRAHPTADAAPRHRDAVSRAAKAIDQAMAVLRSPGKIVASSHDPKMPDEAVVADLLRGALDTLGELTGRVTPDDVLGRIFASFCIGK